MYLLKDEIIKNLNKKEKQEKTFLLLTYLQNL